MIVSCGTIHAVYGANELRLHSLCEEKNDVARPSIKEPVSDVDDGECT
jgi:hypothetical protein